jgi:uncharacterized protein with HEPN domain
MSRRSVDKIVVDLLDAVQAASELVARGRDAYESDRMLRLAGEAVIGRIGDSASKLRDQIGDQLPSEIPWDDVIANRIIVDHVYHRVDYELLWNTLERDVPAFGARLREWALDRGVDLDPASPRSGMTKPPSPSLER